MGQPDAKRILEAILFVSGEPVTVKRIAEVVPDLTPDEAKRLLNELHAEYVTSGRALQVQELAGGYQLVTDPQLAPWVQRARQDQKPGSVSKAALETLAIIAYRQPITKAEIEGVRGVDVSGALETLLERSLVRAAGRKETPGRPFLYATTTEFLRHFGLKSLAELPKVKFPTLQEPGLPTPAAVSGPAEGHDAGSVLDT